MSEEKKLLKRNASENMRKGGHAGRDLSGMVVGGERLRDKNSQDYLETIRENE